jgi:hypothetical protein
VTETERSGFLNDSEIGGTPMRICGISTSLLIVTSGMGVMAAPAAGQPQPPPAPRAQVLGPAGAIGLDQILTPRVPGASVKELVGVPEQAPVELLTWDRAYTLALVRARAGDVAPAEVLDPQALAEQARRHGVADFARFRKDFLAGRPEGGAFHDPGPAYYAVLRRLQAVDDARRHVATLENLSKLLQDLIQGEAAGLSQFDIDFTSEALVRGRQRMSREVVGLRDALDELKVALGLSPRAAVVSDRQALAVFRDVLTAVDAWSRQPDRMLGELPRIVDRLPTPGDALVDGRPILRQIEQAPARMEEVLRDAARQAI